MKDLFKRAADGFQEVLDRCKEWIEWCSRPDLKPSEVPVRIDE